MKDHGGIEESSLWKYFGSYYGDPTDDYQTVGGLFADWQVTTADALYESDKDLLDRKGVTKE